MNTCRCGRPKERRSRQCWSCYVAEPWLLLTPKALRMTARTLFRAPCIECREPVDVTTIGPLDASGPHRCAVAVAA